MQVLMGTAFTFAGVRPCVRAGFDSCSHLSEEIKGANSSAPLAMLWAIAACAVMGYALLVGMLFCVQVVSGCHPCSTFQPAQN